MYSVGTKPRCKIYSMATICTFNREIYTQTHWKGGRKGCREEGRRGQEDSQSVSGKTHRNR